MLLLGVVLAAFGMIHSARPQGRGLPALGAEGVRRELAWQFAGAYAVLAALALQRRAGAPP